MADEIVGLVVERVGRMEDKLDKIAEALNKLATLEVNHVETRAAIARAFDAIKECRDEHRAMDEAMDKRMADVERQMPHIRFATGIITTAVIAGAGLLILAIGKGSGVL